MNWLRSVGARGAPLASLIALAPLRATALDVHISEVLYDALGADDGGVFVELYGPPGLDLGGHLLEGVNGADGAVAPVLALTGTIPADGFFVVADGIGAGTLVPEADLLLEFDLQNGPDSLVLRAPHGAVLDAVGYGAFGPTDVFAGEGQPAPDPPAGSSIARLFADIDTDDNARDFVALSMPTPGLGPTQVPEPSALPLLGLALGGSLVAHRRILSGERRGQRFHPPGRGA
jgi:hypothetical protein